MPKALRITSTPRAHALTGREAIVERLCDVLSEYNIQSVAEAADVHFTTLYNWLEGKTQKPRIDTLARVARALGFDITIQPSKKRANLRVV